METLFVFKVSVAIFALQNYYKKLKTWKMNGKLIRTNQTY